MKMEHVVNAEVSGFVRQLIGEPGDSVPEGLPWS
jgi:biotin carboxyl carrier protein